MRRLTQEQIDKDRRTGKLVRDLRSEADMTRKELARLMGCTPSYLYDLERGYRHWSDKLIKKFEKVCRL